MLKLRLFSSTVLKSYFTKESGVSNESGSVSLDGCIKWVKRLCIGSCLHFCQNSFIDDWSLDIKLAKPSVIAYAYYT